LPPAKVVRGYSRKRRNTSAKLDRNAVGSILWSKLVFLISVRRSECKFVADHRRDEWALIMRAIKCLKGIWWMPWRWEAMKDVLRCDKPRGAAKELWSADFRMGKPTFDNGILRPCGLGNGADEVLDFRYQKKEWDLW
jgi:hypothetical protein